MKTGFTMAEVLITLGVLGIVMALTFPTLLGNYQEKEQIARLKQAYSLIDNAFRLATEEYGTVDTWGTDPDSRRLRAMEILPKYLKTAKVCPKNVKGCIGKTYKPRAKETYGGSTHVNLDGTRDSILLANGISIMFQTLGSECTQNLLQWKQDDSQNKANWLNACFSIDVDTNGPASPNIASLDWFSFLVVQDGIVPNGTASSDNWSWVLSAKDQCFTKKPYEVSNGTNCTAWVLTYENMDYKRCPDKLGWEKDKQKSCK